MKCVMCGHRMKVRHETRRHDLGLDAAVTLEDIEVAHCESCGEEFVGIPRVEELHRLVAHRLAEKASRLSPKEVRFLRTHLGFSGTNFAREMGVTPETVCRWEKADGPTPMGATAERLLRLLVLTQKPHRVYPLRNVASTAPEPFRARLTAAGGRWSTAEACAT